VSAREIAPGLLMLSLAPRDSINAYLAGDVLIDAGTRYDHWKIAAGIGSRPVSAHALTHVHPDHQGASAKFCTRRKVPLYAPEAEASAMEAGEIAGFAGGAQSRFMRFAAKGPGHPVTGTVAEGDVFGGFTAIGSAGHSPDHIAYWRESDRVLIAGDALRNMAYPFLGGHLALPLASLSFDMSSVRTSAQKLIELNPSLVAFGHGSPVDGDTFKRGMEDAGLL
jgi:glyoxylase-like metal-dependent hydrolase (beta-lactamase superfamily II)